MATLLTEENKTYSLINLSPGELRVIAALVGQCLPDGAATEKVWVAIEDAFPISSLPTVLSIVNGDYGTNPVLTLDWT